MQSADFVKQLNTLLAVSVLTADPPELQHLTTSNHVVEEALIFVLILFLAAKPVITPKVVNYGYRGMNDKTFIMQSLKR